MMNFELDQVYLEEVYDNTEYGTTTLYFIAPKDLLGDSYPEAIHSEISLEFPTDNPEARFASAMISPTRETENGYEDYDWRSIELEYPVIESLIQLMMK
ncbi:hypothetical protein [Anaerotignum lactatifermentans]|uniref:hypothetical protein n=1 Tax=Anaerotignum lactatifermentans TaxID=160404 RepID=UPI00174E3BCB|nr:hypothetical protein [Anaerotignum lactatifermentans]